MPDEPSAGPRILIVAPQPFYTDRGTPIATRYLIRALLHLRYRVDVLTYPFGEPLDMAGVGLTRIANPLRIGWVPIGFSWRKCWLDLFLFPAIARCLRDREYACVSALEESAFVAALVAPRFGVPVLYDMQSSLAEQLGHRTLMRNGVSRRLLDACERWLVETVDLTVASAGLAQRVRRASPTAAIHEWRYPGLEESASPTTVAELRAGLGLDGDRVVILYAGNFAEYQGVNELIEAAPMVLARVPNAVLVLVGAGNDHELGEVMKLTEGLPDGSVRVLRRQARESMPGYFALADIVVSPRQFGENLPLKVLDYLAAGTAIVATDIPAHRTVLSEDTALLVGTEPEAIASGITQLLADLELREHLGRRGRAFADEHLGWLGYVLSVGEAYGMVCGNDGDHD